MHFRKKICISMTLLLATQSDVALSQAETQYQLEEIVVTAQRREQRLQDVPISLSVVSGEKLVREGIYTLDDFTSRLPSVKISKGGAGDRIAIRGIDSGANLGFEQAVATFVDGAYRGRSRAARFSFFDVERIEVLRGPQTTFFGNNAIAGAFNITTRKPSGQLEWNTSALYSPTDGEYGVEGGISFPVTDSLAVRIAAKQQGMNGYIDNHHLQNEGPDLDDTMGRLSARWTPSERIEVEARVDYGRMRDTDIYNTELINCPPPAPFPVAGACAMYLNISGGAVDDTLNHKTSTGPSYVDYDFFEVALSTVFTLDNHRLASLTTFSDQDFDYFSSLIPTPNSSAVGTITGLPHRSQEQVEQFSQELRLESTDGEKFDYMVGAYYLHTKLEVPTSTGYYFIPFGLLLPGELLPPTARVADLNLNHEKSETFSVFASSTLHVSSDLRLNLGMRYSIVEKEAGRHTRIGLSDDMLVDFAPATPLVESIVAGFLGFDLLPFDDPDRRDSKFMPTASVEYDLSDDMMAYVSYSMGFKAGGYGTGTTRDTFDSETVDAYEMGLKATFLDNRLSVNIAAFLSLYDDMQEATFVILQSGIPKGTIDNVAKSEVKGIEIGGSWQISPGLQATLDVAYLSSEYDEYTVAPCTSLQNMQPNCVQDMSGKDRGLSPEFSGVLGLSYSTNLTDAYKFRIDTNLYHSSKYYTSSTADPLSVQDAYTKIDMRIALMPDNEKWEIALIGNNLTDERISNISIDVPTSGGSKQVLGERPRSFAIQASMRY